MKTTEIRAMEPVAIRVEIENRRREILEMRCQIKVGEEVRSHRLKEARRDVARLYTILREKEGVSE